MGLLDSKNYGKIKVLLWKSYHSRKYYWVTTLIEALVPIIIALYVTWVIAKHSKQEFGVHPTTYKQVIDRHRVLQETDAVSVLAYTPAKCAFITNLLTNVKKELDSPANSGSSKATVNLKAMENEDDLEKYIMNDIQPAFIMGLVFHDLNESNCEQGPDTLTYELRPSGARDTRTLHYPKDKSGPYPDKDAYIDSGFAGFQLIMNEQYTNVKKKDPNWQLPELLFQAFPYPEYETSSVPRDTLSFVISFSIIITLLALSVPFVNHVTEEKGNGTKALMMLHGVSEWVIWFCWFIHSIMILFISLTIMTIILKYPWSGVGSEPIRFVPFPVLWAILILYCMANMSFTFLFCAIFHQGAFAAFIFVIVSIVEVIFNLSLKTLHIQSSFSLLFCLFPSTAFSKGFDMIRLYEEIGVSAPWQSLMTRSDHNNPVTLGVAIIMLIFDIILYTFLTYYISSINPGKHGIKKSPLYFLESLIPALKSNGKDASFRDDNEWEENYQYIEPPLSNEQPSIQIRELYKEYGSFYAVNGVDMEMYENEITVLLGHNGAGKTTLLGILAGLIIADGGTITYKDMDILENQSEFRETLGVSFQEDRLFPYMTVMNHLLFYGMLKGYSRSEVTEEAENYLSKMDMYEERNSRIKNISEGMKRKLSFMISLMGDSKTLLLDQPTFGMDMQSKVTTWDLLMDIRQGRTIISTAKDMHDAEKIASRIAIMESGVLVSYGTIAFLKKTFGAAYELSISTEISNNKNVTDFVKGYIPNSKVKHEANKEITFKILPSETPRFPDFFEDLENSKDGLRISNIELGYTTLEQILLEIGSLSKSSSTADQNMDIISESQYVDIKEGPELTRLQLITLFKKKFTYTSRTLSYAFARIVFPVLIALLTVRLMELYDFSPGPHLTLDLTSYTGALVMLKKNNLDQKSYDIYSKRITEKGAEIMEVTNDNILDALIDYGRIRSIRYRKKLIFAIDFGNPNKILFNQYMLHSLPIAINFYSNMMLKIASEKSNVEIYTINHPIPNVEESCKVEALVKQRYLLLLQLFFVFSFLTVDILLYFFEFPNMEITRSLTHIQIISKVPIGIYWFTIFVFDFFCFVIIVAVRILLFQVVDDAFNFIAFTPPFRVLLGIILLLGVSGLLFVYILSFYLRPSKETLIKLFVLNFICSAVVLLYWKYEDEIFGFVGKFKIVIRGIEMILLIVPFFNYNLLFIKYMTIWSENAVCDLCAPPLIPQCLEKLKRLHYLVFASEENPYGLLLGFIFLIASIIFYFILFCLINAGVFGYINKILGASKIQDDFSDSNDDVKQERDEIQEIKQSESFYNEVPLLVDGLSKHYFKTFQSYIAVEGVSFITRDGMCFGVLGVDGSGKTTILKMMTAETTPTSGDASIQGISLTSDTKRYVSKIGYCPQTNPLMDELTGREMLALIASLRGISGYDSEVLIDQWISFLKMEKYQHRFCSTYSNGSKRKLCTALALLGNPKVVFLDEPTTDLDPVSTRRLHDIIKKCKSAGLIVVLASPNMEECEILCDRLTILVRGVMQCIGTLKDLKKQYAQGYSVTLKIHYDVTSADETFALEENMTNVFNPQYCELIEEQRGLLRYHISDPAVQWSDLFRNLEDIKNNNPIVEEYIATNTTLDDIFISFSQSEYDPNSSDYY